MSENIQTELQPDATPELIPYVFTENPQQREYLLSLLDMLYRGVHTNTIGIAAAHNKYTNKEDLVILGIEVDGEHLNTYPLARIFSPGEGVETYHGGDTVEGVLKEIHNG